LKTKEAKHKKLKKLKKLNIKTKETKKRYEESLRRFESDLHQQWASVRLTTLNQHTASLLKWQALNATSYELTLARLDFRLQGHWQAYPTAKSVRYRLVWERYL